MNARTRRVLLGAAALLAVAGMMLSRQPKHAAADPTKTLKPYEQYLARPQVALKGTLRRFEAEHPEFRLNASGGRARYGEIVADHLDADLKPVFRSAGRVVALPWTDSAGRWLAPREYIDTLAGDVTGMYAGIFGGAATGQTSFAQLFRDVAGVNASSRTAVTLARDATDYAWEGPIDSSPGTAIGSTLELESMFVHASGASWYLEVETDADIWAFIDETLVIDGGAGARNHEASTSFVRPLITVTEDIELNNDCVMENGDGTPVQIRTTSTRNRAVVLGQRCRIDGDVYLGVGGGAHQVVNHGSAVITGTVAAMTETIDIPEVTIPSIGPSTGDLTIAQAVTVASDLHVDDLTIFSGGRVRIQGDVTIVCDGTLRLSSDAHLDILPGSTLRVYTAGEVFISSTATLNNLTQDPRLAVIETTTTGRVTVNSTSGVFANVLAPRGMLLINNDSSFAGSFTGKSVRVNNGGGLFVEDADQTPRALYRIDLDRLAWLSNGATHHLRLFLADRDGTPSRVRLRTNMASMNLAALPHVGGFD